MIKNEHHSHSVPAFYHVDSTLNYMELYVDSTPNYMELYWTCFLSNDSDGRSSTGNLFIGGFILGGLVIGTLGCVYAPQVVNFSNPN